MKKQLYVLRKYVMASSATNAIRQDKKTPVQDVWIDDEFKKNNPDQLAPCIGFTVPLEEED